MVDRDGHFGRSWRAALSGALAILCLPAIGQDASPPLREQVAWYLGEVRTTSPAGLPLGTSVALVQRTLLSAENRIVERVASIDASKPVREYTTVFEVAGSRFTMKDDEGTFAGTGELAGKPWEWTGWKYDAAFTGQRGGRLQGEDVLTPAGIAAKKSFATADGVVRVLFVEDLKPITKGMYDALHAKLLPDKK